MLRSFLIRNQTAPSLQAVRRVTGTRKVSPATLVPYAFSRRYGVAVVKTDPLTVACHPDTKAVGLLEIQRQYGSQFQLEELATEDFDELLSSLYEQGVYQAAQLMEDIGGN